MNFRPECKSYLGEQYYLIVITDDPVWKNRETWIVMDDWCHDMFGPRDNRNDWPTANDRWFANNRSFWFKNQADQIMFMMKWS